MAKKKRTQLPRVTVLAYSRAELQRLSDRQEEFNAAVLALTDLVVHLQQAVTRLEGQISGDYRPRGRRKAPAAVLIHPPETGLPDSTAPAQVIESNGPPDDKG